MRDFLKDAEGAAERGDIGPGKANRGRDKPVFPNRFYKTASVEKKADGYAVTLDNKPVKTPGRNELILPTEPAAELVADEWRAVEKEINPLLMPVTRLTNTAVDGVAVEMQAVMEDVVRYASSDLVCYRADSPEGLVENQQKCWDPVLDWAEAEFGARFEISTGIMHVTQPRDAIAAFGNRLSNHEDPFRMACIHLFTSLTGSALIALSLAEAQYSAEKAWEVAHVDEDWNISQWGEDYEAAGRRKQRWNDFEAAYKLLTALD